MAIKEKMRASLVERAARIQAGDQGDQAEQTRWFVTLVACNGWPGRRTVGADGAHAAFVLAARCPVQYRQGWLPKIRSAVAGHDVSQYSLQNFERQLAADSASESVR